MDFYDSIITVIVHLEGNLAPVVVELSVGDVSLFNFVAFGDREHSTKASVNSKGRAYALTWDVVRKMAGFIKWSPCGCVVPEFGLKTEDYSWKVGESSQVWFEPCASDESISHGEVLDHCAVRLTVVHKGVLEFLWWMTRVVEFKLNGAGVLCCSLKFSLTIDILGATWVISLAESVSIGIVSPWAFFNTVVLEWFANQASVALAYVVAVQAGTWMTRGTLIGRGSATFATGKVTAFTFTRV